MKIYTAIDNLIISDRLNKNIHKDIVSNQILNYSSSELNCEQLENVINDIPPDTELQSLILSKNKISDTGAKCLAKFLAKNKTLKVLMIDYNQITDEGIKAIAESLKKNNTLGTLTISFNNKLTCNGLKRLSDALLVNTSLTVVNIGMPMKYIHQNSSIISVMKHANMITKQTNLNKSIQRFLISDIQNKVTMLLLINNRQNRLPAEILLFTTNLLASLYYPNTKLKKAEHVLGGVAKLSDLREFKFFKNDIKSARLKINKFNASLDPNDEFQESEYTKCLVM